jgi:hypothetical protein
MNVTRKSKNLEISTHFNAYNLSPPLVVLRVEEALLIRCFRTGGKKQGISNDSTYTTTERKRPLVRCQIDRSFCLVSALSLLWSLSISSRQPEYLTLASPIDIAFIDHGIFNKKPNYRNSA